jgi:hypothetical protein
MIGVLLSVPLVGKRAQNFGCFLFVAGMLCLIAGGIVSFV